MSYASLRDAAMTIACTKMTLSAIVAIVLHFL